MVFPLAKHLRDACAVDDAATEHLHDDLVGAVVVQWRVTVAVKHHILTDALLLERFDDLRNQSRELPFAAWGVLAGYHDIRKEGRERRQPRARPRGFTRCLKGSFEHFTPSLCMFTVETRRM